MQSALAHSAVFGNRFVQSSIGILIQSFFGGSAIRCSGTRGREDGKPIERRALGRLDSLGILDSRAVREPDAVQQKCMLTFYA